MRRARWPDADDAGEHGKGLGMTLDARLSKTSGREMFTGSQLLVKGALESPLGVHLFTGHASPPVAPFFSLLARAGSRLDARRQAVNPAVTDALALAGAMAAVEAGQHVVSAHSAQGLASAADLLCDLGARRLPADSALLLLAVDDPWGNQSRGPAPDVRMLAQQSRLPLLEPATPQDLKDFVRLALEMSHTLRHAVAMIVPSDLLHGGGAVHCQPNPPLTAGALMSGSLGSGEASSTLEAGPARERLADQRLALFRPEARRLAINQLLHRPVKGDVAPLGFIGVGQAGASLAHALESVGLLGRLPFLRLAMPFPFDDALLLEMLRCSARIVVVEERRAFVERLVSEAALQLHQLIGAPLREVWGRQFPRPHAGLPAHQPLHPSLLIDRIEPLLRELPDMPADLVHAELSPLAVEARRVRALMPGRQGGGVSLPLLPPPPPRAATFCPGCPHRDAASVFHELRRDLLDPQYMLERHKRQPVAMKVYADAGCASLMANDPHGMLVHAIPPSGLGPASIEDGPDTRHLVLLGDGAFFRAGFASLSQSIASLRDLTVVVLDNHVAGAAEQLAHPGHPAPAPGDGAGEAPPEGVGQRGRKPRPAIEPAGQDIERVIGAMIPRSLSRELHVVRIDPADRARFRRLVEQSLLSRGLQVIVADKECGLTHHRRLADERHRQEQAQGYVARQTFMNVATEVCEYCLECTARTGCTALAVTPTDHGPKIHIDLTSCVDDGACQRIDACPSFETVIVTRSRPPLRADWIFDDSPLPAPAASPERDALRVLVAGVGGQGVSVLTETLAHAGHHAGFEVQYTRQRGQAVRTGPVHSQMVFSRVPQGSEAALPVGAPVPHPPAGQVDLLLALDPLEGLRLTAPGPNTLPLVTPSRTAAAINGSLQATVGALVGRDRLDAGEIDRKLRAAVNPARSFTLPISEQAELLLGSAQVANMMLLGAAFQRGLLPFDAPVLQQAIRAVAPDRIELNLRAFHVGRRLALDRRLESAPVVSLASSETPRVTLHRKTRSLRERHPGRRGRRLAKQLRIVLRRSRREAMAPEAPGGRRRPIPDDLWCQVVVRAHDCMVWDGREYAERYLRLVVDLFRRDSAAFGYALTRAAIDSLARVMVIKDEVYVAAMLTSPEKYEADRRRFNIQPDRGDAIQYVHHNHPEFEVLGRRIRFEWKSRDWQLRAMARLGVLRHVLPGWHARERDFRDWFESVVLRVDWTPEQGPRAYQKWVTILSLPQQVTGYREVRYPKMDLVRRRVLQLATVDPSLFEPAPTDPRHAPEPAPALAGT